MYKSTQDFWVKKRGLREMDASVLNYFKNILNIQVSTQDGNTQIVPVFFATAERRYTSDNPDFLDKNGTLKKPFMRLKRASIDRTKGFYGSAAEDSHIRISKQIHGKTNNLQNLSRARDKHTKPSNVIYEVVTVPFPDYFTATYELEIETVYIKTMNEILETVWQNLDFINSFKIPDEGTVATRKDTKDSKGFFYVGFLDVDVRDESNLDDYTDQEREIKQILSFRVGGIVLNATDNMPNALSKEEGVFRMRKQYTSYKIKFNSDDESIIADTDEEIEKLMS
jgi:hypothetical protein